MKQTQLEFNWTDEHKSNADLVRERSPLQELTTPNPTEEPTPDASIPQRPPRPPSSNYDPGHPWYYLPQGDNRPPLPADQIVPAEGVGRFIEKELPKGPAKRTMKLRELLEIERQDLAIDIERYEELSNRGCEALSKYDREIAHGGNDELARASALALKFNHIAWGLGRVAWLEQELRKPGTTASASRARNTRKR